MKGKVSSRDVVKSIQSVGTHRLFAKMGGEVFIVPSVETTWGA